MSSASFSSAGEKTVLFVGALLLSVLTGAFVANVDFLWVLAVIGVLGAAVMVASREATLWFVVITGFVLVGVSQMYLPGAKYFKYLPPLAAGGLLLHVASEWLSQPHRYVPRTVPLFLAFLLLGLLSLAANWDGFGMAIVGLKSYYPMWSLFLGLALIRWNPRLIDTLPKAAVLIGLLQLPFVLHQLLFLVPMRMSIPGVVAVDIVAGTFGGDVMGGGANAVLSIFLITLAACLLGLWRQGAVSAFGALFGTMLFLAPVFVNGSRVAILYLPIVFGMVLFTDIVRRPLRALVGFMVAALLIVGMLTSFTLMSQSANVRSWEDLLVTTVENQMASEGERSDNYSGLSRWTVLTFWAEQQQRFGVMETLIGHGPGATRVQEEGLDLATTLAERRYGGRQIGYTAVAALLWEVGVLGLGLVLAIFYVAYRQAGTLAKFYAERNPVRSGIAQGLRPVLVILVLSLAHKDFFAFHIPYQTLVACVLGYLAALTNFMAQDIEEHVEQEAPQLLTADGWYE